MYNEVKIGAERINREDLVEVPPVKIAEILLRYLSKANSQKYFT